MKHTNRQMPYRDEFQQFMQTDQDAKRAQQLEQQGLYRRALRLYQTLMCREPDAYKRRLLFAKIRTIANQLPSAPAEHYALMTLIGNDESPFIDKRDPLLDEVWLGTDLL